MFQHLRNADAKNDKDSDKSEIAMMKKLKAMKRAQNNIDYNTDSAKEWLMEWQGPSEGGEKATQKVNRGKKYLGFSKCKSYFRLNQK